MNDEQLTHEPNLILHTPTKQAVIDDVSSFVEDVIALSEALVRVVEHLSVELPNETT